MGEVGEEWDVPQHSPSCISPHVVASRACMRGSVLRIATGISQRHYLSPPSIHPVITSSSSNSSPFRILISHHHHFLPSSLPPRVCLFILHCGSASSPTPPSSQLSSHQHQGQHFVFTRHDPLQYCTCSSPLHVRTTCTRLQSRLQAGLLMLFTS